MTSHGKHGSQKNQFLPTQRAIYNYANVDTISGYNSFFSGATEGGDIVPENTLVLTNDNSVLHFAANFDSGFDTLHDWTCIFDDALLSESRNASVASANGALSADFATSSLSMQVAADGDQRSAIILESKNYLKMPESGRTYIEYQGVFKHPGETNNATGITIRQVGSSAVAQSAWNIDTFGADPARNPSGITLDFKKVQTAIFEFTGKNKGDVRVGFLVGNTYGVSTIYFAHKFKINNAVDNTKTLNLPIRDEFIVTSGSVDRIIGLYNQASGYTIETNMDTAADPTLPVQQYLNSVVCYTVGSDHVEKKVPFSAGNKETFKNVTTVNAPLPLFSIQCAGTFNGAVNRTMYNLDMLQINSSSQDENFGCYIKVLYNATLVGDNFVALPDNAQSALKHDISATSVSGGIELFSTYIMANEVSTFFAKDIFKNYRDEFSRNEIAGLIISTQVLNQTLTVVASPMTGLAPIIPTTSIAVSANIFGGEIG